MNWVYSCNRRKEPILLGWLIKYSRIFCITSFSALLCPYFFLDVYTFIYLTPFLFTSMFVIFISFLLSVLTLLHACLLPSFTFLTISFFFLVSFRRFRKAMCKIGYQVRDVSPSVSPYGSVCLPLEVFS